MALGRAVRNYRLLFCSCLSFWWVLPCRLGSRITGPRCRRTIWIWHNRRRECLARRVWIRVLPGEFYSRHRRNTLCASTSPQSWWIEYSVDLLKRQIECSFNTWLKKVSLLPRTRANDGLSADGTFVWEFVAKTIATVGSVVTNQKGSARQLYAAFITRETLLVPRFILRKMGGKGAVDRRVRERKRTIPWTWHHWQELSDWKWE